MTDILTLMSSPMIREQKLELALKMARSWMHCVEPRLLDTPNFKRDMEALDAALSAPKAEAEKPCPVCKKPFAEGDKCATDIEIGTCHAECLADNPTVDLKTGEPMDGPIGTFPHVSPKAEAVTVKPLVWEELGGDYFAHSLVGQYGIGIVQESYIATPRSIDDTGQWNDEVFARGIGRAGDGIGLPKAKAAAQADYEARILSAIDTSPVPKAEAVPREWPDIDEDDPDVMIVAKAIAENGIGRPWDDFLQVNVSDFDHGDLIEYGRAAVAAMRTTSPVPALTDEAISVVWTAAMTAACNIVIKRQNDLNDDDGPCDILNEQGEIISAIKKWLAPDTTYLNELRSMMPVTALTDEAVYRAVRAHDREDASHRGEPDPWEMDISEDEKAERMFAMRTGLLAAFPSKGGTNG